MLSYFSWQPVTKWIKLRVKSLLFRLYKVNKPGLPGQLNHCFNGDSCMPERNIFKQAAMKNILLVK